MNKLPVRRRLAALVGAIVFAAGVLVASPAYASGSKSTADSLPVCNGESLNLIHPSGRQLTAAEIEIGRRSVQSLCDSQNAVQPFGSTYGNYVTNATNATKKTCSCGAYLSWTIKVTAVGLPASGDKNLNVIYRQQPGNSAWSYGPSNYIGPTTTYGNLPLVSGTMPLNTVIQSYGTYSRNGSQVESIYNSASAF